MTGEVKSELEHIAIFPNSHYVVDKEKMAAAIENIKEELKERIAYLRAKISLLRHRELRRELILI